MKTLENRFMIIDEFFLNLTGRLNQCDQYYFSEPSLATEFTDKMNEKFGEEIKNKWYFMQTDSMNHSHIPVLGEPCFVREKGNISAMYRLLKREDIDKVFQMVYSVAEELEISVIKQTRFKTKEYDKEFENKYELLMLNGKKCEVPQEIFMSDTKGFHY